MFRKFSFVVIGFLVLTLCVPANAQDDLIHSQTENVMESKAYTYGYDSLMSQLNKWRLNPYIVIDSIGKRS